MDTKKGIFYFPPPQAFLNSNSPQNIQITIFVGRAARSAKALLLRVKNLPKAQNNMKKAFVFATDAQSYSVQ